MSQQSFSLIFKLSNLQIFKLYSIPLPSLQADLFIVRPLNGTNKRANSSKVSRRLWVPVQAFPPECRSTVQTN
jgi:hypothetical protein